MIEIMTDFYAQPRKNGAEMSYVSETYHTTTKEKPRNHKMKRKIEVSIRQLTREDRERFVTAKAKEWTSWLDKEAIEIVKNAGIPRSHIMKARWVLTWKSVGTAKEPKARLCVLGYTDPRLTTLETSSPTLTGDGEALIMQWVVNHRHTLESGDLKTAFLPGDVDEARMGDEAIHVDMPADVKSWIRLGPDEALRLRKAVYGLINAPLRWHLRLSRALKEAGFIPLLMDECVWILADEIPPQAAPTEVAQMLRDRMAGQRENPTT